MKLGDIALGWMLYYAVPPLRHNERVSSHRLLPFASRLSPIPIHFFGDIDGIVDRALTLHYAITNQHAIPHNNGIHTPALLNILNL